LSAQQHPVAFGKLPRNVPPRRSGRDVTDGSVMIIGGAEDKIRDRVILSRFTTLAGGTDAVSRRASDLITTDPLTAVRLCELALAVDARHRGALDAYKRAHEQLLVEHGRENFWLTRWLEGEVRSTTNRLERLGSQ